MGLNLIIKNLLNMHSRLPAAQTKFVAAHPSLAAAQTEEQPENVWQVLTSYRAMLAYAIILMVAVAAIMVLLIVRSARDVKQREAEKRKREARRRFSRLAQLDSEAEKRGKVNQPKYEGDLERFCRGVLEGRVLSDRGLRYMARNRTGHPVEGGGYTQYLGSQCYVRHPEQVHSEVPEYMSGRSIAISGFTGHHLSIDPEKGLFIIALGDRVLNRLSMLIPEEGKTLTD